MTYPLSRHWLSLTLMVAIIVASFVPAIATPMATVAQSSFDDLGLAPEMIPPDMGQTERHVYVKATGHTIMGTMLDYWRATGGASVYGNPISEPYAAPNGLYSQAFERGIFQYNPDVLWTDDPTVRLAQTGSETIAATNRRVRADGRRAAPDRRVEAWRPVTESETRSADVWNDGGTIDETTGHSLSGDMQDWYNSHEGWFYLGLPLSEPHRARGITAQYFEGGVLLEHDGRVWPAPLPAESPKRFGIDTKRVERGDLPTYDESLFIDVPNPGGVDPTELSGRRRIEVSISEQMLRAWQGDDLVLETLVSTGLEPNTTETGTFHVRIKFEEQDMAGFTNSSGEVVALGDGDAPEGSTPRRGQEQYEVEDVPNIMYFNFDAEALHGAYWHDNFGQPMSHGCVNLPLDVAAFLFEWAPLGTEVTVSE